MKKYLVNSLQLQKLSRLRSTIVNVGFYNPINLDLKIEFPTLNDFELDKLQYLIHLIYEQKALYRIKTEFVPLKAVYLRKILRDHKHYRDLLEIASIIQCDYIYVKNSKSFGLKLTDKYSTQHYKKIPIRTEKIKTKIQAGKIDLDLCDKTHRFLLENLKKISIDYESASQLLNPNELESFTSDKIRLKKILEKDWFFKQDKYGRIHTNITTLTSKYRQFLSVNDEHLVNIDIRNSQPLFLLIALNNIINNNTIRCALLPTKEELEKYSTLVQQGSIYEFFSDVYGCDRSTTKKKIFMEMFSKTISKEFRDIFPNLSFILDYLKGKDYRRVAWMMQREESKLMINQVCGDLASQNIFLATIHDSILTTKQNVEAVKTTILDRFSDLRIIPTLKIENS